MLSARVCQEQLQLPSANHSKEWHNQKDLQTALPWDCGHAGKKVPGARRTCDRGHAAADVQGQSSASGVDQEWVHRQLCWQFGDDIWQGFAGRGLQCSSGSPWGEIWPQFLLQLRSEAQDLGWQDRRFGDQKVCSPILLGQHRVWPDCKWTGREVQFFSFKFSFSNWQHNKLNHSFGLASPAKPSRRALLGKPRRRSQLNNREARQSPQEGLCWASHADAVSWTIGKPGKALKKGFAGQATQTQSVEQFKREDRQSPQEGLCWASLVLIRVRRWSFMEYFFFCRQSLITGDPRLPQGFPKQRVGNRSHQAQEAVLQLPGG